ncbi:hypothetical protein M378DRAFT_86388 [Amanita muscaria Koide BX008]|uniref:Acetyl-coenzyme A transporter 1 n=1 Tax=Amanita muscaria (strain Koide BX008) TaxID=946122 RepID=A0A0C2S732_AMAMK|nr:hypothetical protein M378DRAFT_86388 [Amanita muscaria Koide BX008]
MSLRSKANPKANAATGTSEDSTPGAALRVTSSDNLGVSSSLNSTHIIRTAKTQINVPEDASDNSVELSLLQEEERRKSGLDEIKESPNEHGHEKRKISAKDKRGMVLLCVLYLMQGIPLGLAMESVPFLLNKHRLPLSQLATFTLSSYPYSLKLLWSPIVDSVYFVSIGRRKSWIIPMQLIVGTLMLYLSLNVQRLMDDPSNHVAELTTIFTSLVFFSATQDIAVDGWALTLLSKDCLSYASTCQTIGITTGSLASFTVFLAFNSPEFADKWGIPQLTLSAYLKFWSTICYAVTFWLIFFKKEDKEPNTEADMSIKSVYATIWSICKLKNIQLLVIMYFFAKVGFAANDAVTSRKLVEKGYKQEELAIVSLIDFPIQIIGAWLAANVSQGQKPLRPWVIAFWPRLGLAFIATLIVYYFPEPITHGFFTFLVVHTVISNFAATVQFGGVSSFHTLISDPLIGGTYMTLLNTFSNLGGTWPKWFVLRGVDLFNEATCHVPGELSVKVTTFCAPEQCHGMGGECVILRDGYYIVSGLCMAFGVAFLIGYIIPTARKLQALPISEWRVKA